MFLAPFFHKENTVARYDKAAWLAAVAIHQRLLQGPCVLALPRCTWQELDKLHRQIRHADRHGWHAARRRLLESLQLCAQRLEGHLERLLVEVHREAAQSAPQSTAEIYRDILALKQDYPEVVVDPEHQELVVATEEIVLEGINLGPFEIRLDYGQPDLSYRVVATQPYPATGRDDVTHPHVQDDSLCEGEGRAAIRAALDEGRLADFYLIVTRILSSYASGRAYVELADWDGAVCSDCGRTVSSHDRYFCEHCDTTLCEDCYADCPHCNLLCCSQCLQTCDGCQESYCKSCLDRCPGCGKRLCPSCFDADHHQNCEKRHDRETPSDTSGEAETSAISAQHQKPLEPAPCV